MSSHEFKAYTKKSFNKIKQLYNIPKYIEDAVEVSANVIPFRVSSYVLDKLIDWDNVPEDPVFQLTFPQPGMIDDKRFAELHDLYFKNDTQGFKQKARDFHLSMNPHPANQTDLNAAVMDKRILSGMQHKYDETVLFFPSQGQLCHSYCTYCFRWAQFIGLQDLKFASREKESLYEYIKRNTTVTDLLFTGGDPMVMKTSILERYLEAFLKEKPGNLENIRIGTKALAYWPYRFYEDKDSDDLIRLFEKIIEKGYHLALMAHFSHNRELETPEAVKAIRRLKSVGVEIRTQAPLIRHVNNSSEVWAEMWKQQVKLGAVPYYMFIERDTGPKSYFEVPLAEAYETFTNAYKNISGLCRTVRGPSMSASPGKVMVDGIAEINNEKVFVLKFVQARDTDWVNKVFFAKFDDKASWLDELVPAFNEKEFFFEQRYNQIKEKKLNLLNSCASV
ncbi:MAG: KamA family radical SAM protein [Thermodesulfobacteriota bacterium]